MNIYKKNNNKIPSWYPYKEKKYCLECGLNEDIQPYHLYFCSSLKVCNKCCHIKCVPFHFPHCEKINKNDDNDNYEVDTKCKECKHNLAKLPCHLYTCSHALNCKYCKHSNLPPFHRITCQLSKKCKECCHAETEPFHFNTCSLAKKCLECFHYHDKPFHFYFCSEFKDKYKK